MFQITLTGNLGSAPRVKNVGEDKTVCTLNIAVKDGSKTVWVTVEDWSKAATAHAQHLHTGSKILIVAKPKTDQNGKPRAWFNGEGQPQTQLEYIAQTVEYL